MATTTAAACRTGTGRAPGTCGELAQGQLPGGVRFHVTCPIDRSATVRVRVRPSDRAAVTGLPARMWKTRRALLRAAELLELGPVEIGVETESELESCKGMASSTADIVAAVRALGTAAGQPVDDAAVAALAAQIEPTDGVMFSGARVVDHRNGELLRAWAWTPAFVIAMFSPVACRATDPRGGPDRSAAAHEYAALLHRLDAAVAARDPLAFASEATHSAQLNEHYAPNPLLPHLAPHRASTGAAGLCVGHSGTVCGLLFEGADAAALASEAVARLPQHVPALTTAAVVRMPNHAA